VNDNGDQWCRDDNEILSRNHEGLDDDLPDDTAELVSKIFPQSRNKSIIRNRLVHARIIPKVKEVQMATFDLDDFDDFDSLTYQAEATSLSQIHQSELKGNLVDDAPPCTFYCNYDTNYCVDYDDIFLDGSNAKSTLMSYENPRHTSKRTMFHLPCDI
jgi:hypothetical protein